MTQTTVYLGSTDADPNDDFNAASVGVDSAAGLYIVTETGNEINIDIEVQEQIYEALRDHFIELGRWED